MSHESELRRLEQFVEKLLAGFSGLRAEKERLLEELGERELQIEELRANLSSKEAERSEISQRVSKIVEQIEEWETGMADETVDAAEPEAVEEIVISGEDEVPLDSDLYKRGGQHLSVAARKREGATKPFLDRLADG